MDDRMDLKARLVTALLLPPDSTDQDVVDAVKALLDEYGKVRRRLVEEGTDLYQELTAARAEIRVLAQRLEDLNQKNPG